MMLTLDIPKDVVQALDLLVSRRRAAYEAAKNKAKAKDKDKGEAAKPLTKEQLAQAKAIADSTGPGAANRWIREQQAVLLGGRVARGVGRPREVPSRRMLVEEALRAYVDGRA